MSKGVTMKKIFISIALIFSAQAWAAEESYSQADQAAVRELDALEAAKDPEQQWIASAAKANKYMRQDCPVVGNTQSNIYHMPGQPNYRMMLVVNKCVAKKTCKDNRKCFEHEGEAKAAGFKKAANKAR